MKKLTAGIFATLLTVVTVGVANADIASTAWVNSKIGEVNTGVEGVDSKIEGVQQTVNSQAADIAELDELVVGLSSEVETFDTALSAAESKITTLETEVGKKLDSTTASNTYATKTALDSKLNKNLGAGSSGNILTVGSDGAITSSATIAQGKVNGLTTTLAGKANASDLTALEQTVEGKADASDLTALETEVGNKLDKNLGTGKSGQILTVGSDGAITSSATIAQSKVSGLTTTLAGKADKATTLAGYGITDGATKTELDDKADASDLTALETEVGKKLDSTTASNTYATKSALNAKADASALTALETEITTATETATEAKTAADAATEAASTATSTANAAKSAADAATKAAETATSTASAAKTAAETATSTANAAKTAAESAASSASSAVTSASKAIPKPADDEVNSNGTYVLTYKIGTGYAWELISRQ